MDEQQKLYLSKEKVEELKAELEHLKKVDRKEVAETLEYAKSLGDLSENAEYHEARDKQADIEDRISEIEAMLKDAVIATVKGTQTVQIGSNVVIKKANGQKEEYTIVGGEEADLLSGKISYKSPLGGAVLDKKKGDKVTVHTPKGDVEYEILEIK